MLRLDDEDEENNGDALECSLGRLSLRIFDRLQVHSHLKESGHAKILTKAVEVCVAGLGRSANLTIRENPLQQMDKWISYGELDHGFASVF